VAAHTVQRGAIPAARKLGELVDSPNTRVALAAAIAILDRAGYGQVDARCTIGPQAVMLSAEQANLIRQTLEMEEL
jgi:hypothetical protein